MTLEENRTELLFSYGTLQQESVQLRTFGRRLEGQRDSLIGYSLRTVEIEDQTFAATNGSQQRNAHNTGDAADVIDGVVFRITRQELEAADTYEPRDYQREVVQLKSGVNAWLYVKC